MAKHQVVGDSPFLKRVLIPFWVIRILIMVVEIGIYGIAIYTVATYKDDLSDAGYGDRTTTTVIAIIAVVEILVIACLALDIVCIVKRARRTLSPKFFLIVNIAQTVIWTIMFVLAMIGSARGNSPIVIIIDIVVYFSFLGLLIYAGVIFHRHRKGTLRGAYVPAINPALGDQQGLVYGLGPAAEYPSYPGHAAYGEPLKQPQQYEMDTQQPQTYGYVPQSQGDPPQQQGYAPQQHGYPQYGNVS